LSTFLRRPFFEVVGLFGHYVLLLVLAPEGIIEEIAGGGKKIFDLSKGDYLSKAQH
jgi:hypothetical protein